MPKLDQAKTAFMLKQFGEPSPPLAPGTYTGTLREVRSNTDSQYSRGRLFWVWTFDVEGRRLPLHTEISDEVRALWKLNRAFHAFGAKPDKLIGTKVRVVISESSSEWINRVLPLTEATKRPA